MLVRRGCSTRDLLGGGGENLCLELIGVLAEALLLHDWPLNARELDNLLHRCASQCDRGEPFDVHLLPVAMTRLIEGRDAANVATDTPPRTALEAALTAAGGNVARVAEQFGRDRAQVYRWLRRHNLDPATFRG